MFNLNRVENAKRNITFGFVNRIINIALPFLVRTFIIRCFGPEYLGFNTFCTSVLQVLNLAELGLSSAAVYCMYKPLSVGDAQSVGAVLGFLRKVYLKIGWTIFAFGIIFALFLKLFFDTNSLNQNVYIIYFIYLISTVLSYWLYAYKNALLLAAMREDIISKVVSTVNIIASLIKLAAIVWFNNFYLFAIAFVFATVAQNIAIHIATKKLFSNVVAKGELSTQTKKDLIIKVKGRFVENICHTFRVSFDSIFVTAFLGLDAAAAYNNYFYIISSLSGFMCISANAISAGVGNSMAVETIEKNYADMKKIDFIYMLCASVATACLLATIQPFCVIFFGENLLFKMPVVVLFAFYFYLWCMSDIRGIYSQAAGLWWESRFFSIAEALSVLVLNYILGYFWNQTGIVLATLVPMLMFNFYGKATVLFKHKFKTIDIKEYIQLHTLYLAVTVVVVTVSYFVTQTITFDGIIGLCVKATMSMAVAVLLSGLIYYKTNIYKISIAWIKDIYPMLKKIF